VDQAGCLEALVNEGAALQQRGYSGDQSPSPGSGEKYFSNLSGWSSNCLASVGGGFF
jgi:hypothetical protein